MSMSSLLLCLTGRDSLGLHDRHDRYLQVVYKWCTSTGVAGISSAAIAVPILTVVFRGRVIRIICTCIQYVIRPHILLHTVFPSSMKIPTMRRCNSICLSCGDLPEQMNG